MLGAAQAVLIGAAGRAPEPEPEPLPQADITITVPLEIQHQFLGFASSVQRRGNPYEAGKVGRDSHAYNRAWLQDVGTWGVRWWGDFGTGSADRFVARYVDSGAAEIARDGGVETFFYAPTAHVGEMPSGWVSGGNLRTDHISDYVGNILSDMVILRDDHGVTFEALEQINEPGSGDRMGFNQSDWQTIAETFRGELDQAGFAGVQLLGPSWQPPSSPHPVNYLNAVGLSGLLDGHAMHCYSEGGPSYGLGQLGLQMGLPCWQTEAGGARSAADAAARFLASLNNGCAVWTWFIGPGSGASMNTLIGVQGDGFARSIAYDALKTVSTAFPAGTRITHCTSSRNGHMDYFRGNEHLYTTAGVRPDGKVAIGLSNPTGSPTDQWFNFLPAATFTVALDVPRPGGTVFRRSDGGTWQVGESLSMAPGQVLTLIEG